MTEKRSITRSTVRSSEIVTMLIIQLPLPSRISAAGASDAGSVSSTDCSLLAMNDSIINENSLILLLGRVFKARNGTHIVVNKDGSVTTKSITGKLFNSFLTNAGYITERPDSGWDPLFDSKSSSPGETILKNDA